MKGLPGLPGDRAGERVVTSPRATPDSAESAWALAAAAAPFHASAHFSFCIAFNQQEHPLHTRLSCSTRSCSQEVLKLHPSLAVRKPLSTHSPADSIAGHRQRAGGHPHSPCTAALRPAAISPPGGGCVAAWLRGPHGAGRQHGGRFWSAERAHSAENGSLSANEGPRA